MSCSKEHLCLEQMVQRGGCVPGGAGWGHLPEAVSKAELSLVRLTPQRSSSPHSSAVLTPIAPNNHLVFVGEDQLAFSSQLISEVIWDTNSMSWC